MTTTGESSQDLYSAYRSEIEGQALARALYRAVVVLFVINTVFIAVDWIIYPDRVTAFLPVRIGLDCVLALLFAFTVRRFPVASTLATSAAGGWMLFTVVSGTGGAASDYYVGLVLLLIGIGVLVPLSARQGSLAISILFGCYVALVLGDGPEDWKRLSLSLFFLGAAAFVGIMSCAYLDRMRFSDFVQRREIEKARDELRELDVAKSRFTANIHHELRTPLTLTLAPVEAMLGGEFGEISEIQRSYLKTIRGNGLRLLKLINNLLDLAKIESQQLEVRRRPIRVGEVVEEIVSGATPLAERKGIALSMQGFDSVPVLCADSDALEKILVNLLGNALKFTDAGGTIEVRATVPEDGGVHVVVADSGIGIPPDQLARVFDRFAQVDGSTTRRHEGTGIGLSLVKELVELHGGLVWVESEGLGHGAQMHVVLPTGESDADGAEGVEEAIVGGEARANSLGALRAELDVDGSGEPDDASYGDALRLAELRRNVERTEEEGLQPVEPADAGQTDAEIPEVLIVEDNPDMRRLLADLVGREFRIRVARNGREGLERVRERRPDLVLTDVMMPEMSGTELCAAIKADPEIAGTPVVLVTSKAEREMKIEGLELGADDYVTKPFHPRELMARVRSLVRLRRMQDELAVRNALLLSTNEELSSTMKELREAGAQLVQAERLAAVGELAAGIAHEVNNPVNFALNAIKTLRVYVDDIGKVARQITALDSDDPSRLGYQLEELAALREHLQFDDAADALGELTGIVAEGLERTSRLVGDLRHFAAPGDQRSSEVDLARGLRSTLQLVSHSLSEAKVQTHVDVPDSLPALEGDARALNQVFLNLLKNAAEAFEGRGGVIQVRAVPEGDSILVEIRDDGPGVAADLEARVFEPFFSTKEAGRGSGLGLSISRRIVNEHGGTIDLETLPGAGCCFRVRLPIRNPGPSLVVDRAAEIGGDSDAG